MSEAAEAAERAAAAAKQAAEDARVTVEADVVASGAKKAFHNNEAKILAEDEKKRPKEVRGGLGETI